MDEIWVPSDFNIRTFAGAGIPARKLHQVRSRSTSHHRRQHHGTNNKLTECSPLGTCGASVAWLVVAGGGGGWWWLVVLEGRYR